MQKMAQADHQWHVTGHCVSYPNLQPLLRLRVPARTGKATYVVFVACALV